MHGLKHVKRLKSSHATAPCSERAYVNRRQGLLQGIDTVGSACHV